MALEINRELILRAFAETGRRIFFLDYDGTLVPFHDHPQNSVTDERVLNILRNLAASPKNRIYIVSGRDKKFLSRQLGDIPVGLIAEHGCLIREHNGAWNAAIPFDNSWMAEGIRFCERISDLFPGTFVETKEASVVFHYRTAGNLDEEKLFRRIRKEFPVLSERFPGLELMNGNKVIEIKPVICNKGNTARMILNKGTFDFVLAAGDDTSDEQLFEEMPAGTFTIKIGTATTRALFFMKEREEFIGFLERMQCQGQ
jgi:trehalose 6-phosphate synthase/phosphatase